MHHVYARGVERRRIFLSDVDLKIYLDVLGRVAVEMGWRCLAYCLMPNHVHLLIQTPEPNLGVGIQRLHGMYAQDFNERHARIGHLFQGRYGATRIWSEQKLSAILEYIALNPVRAGLCSRPADWPWSSRGAMAAGPAPSWLHARPGLPLSVLT